MEAKIQISNYDKASIICGYLLTMENNHSPFSRPERADERAADLAQEIAEYLGVKVSDMDEDEDEYSEVYLGCFDAVNKLFPSAHDEDAPDPLQ
jgi:hypothetical protein